MRRLISFAALLFSFTVSGTSQMPHVGKANPTQQLDRFVVSGVSRLNALARLGAATDSTLLIVCGETHFLNETITLDASHKTQDEIIIAILHGRERYLPIHRGLLIVVSPTAPSVPTNRILELPLGKIAFDGKSISSLSPLLAFYIRTSTGCNPSGYGYAGPPMVANIPPFTLRSATFQSVLERVAGASLPTMWVLLPDSGKSGCIPDPGSMWQVGLYAGPNSDNPFQESIGPQLVH
jgi:hypothetical protein